MMAGMEHALFGTTHIGDLFGEEGLLKMEYATDLKASVKIK